MKDEPSSSRCRGLVCSVWLWHFLVMLNYILLININTYLWKTLVLISFLLRSMSTSRVNLDTRSAQYDPTGLLIKGAMLYQSSLLFFLHWCSNERLIKQMSYLVIWQPPVFPLNLLKTHDNAWVYKRGVLVLILFSSIAYISMQWPLLLFTGTRERGI